jgi:hypothetical protein
LIFFFLTFFKINGTCAHQDLTSKTMREEKRCPAIKQIELPCSFNYSNKLFKLNYLVIVICFGFKFYN